MGSFGRMLIMSSLVTKLRTLVVSLLDALDGILGLIRVTGFAVDIAK
jgi:hypothetical protein